MTPPKVNFALPPAAYASQRSRSNPLVCGECTLCCKVMAVPELEKPKDKWCAFAKAGKGCSCYTTRPERCQTFNCLWLSGHFGDGQVRFRPDRIHAVVTPTNDGKNWVIHEDPGYPGFARAALRTVIHRFTQHRDHYVVVVCGSQRSFFGDPAKYRELIAQGKLEG